MSQVATGKVYLVGAGPGDPGLITVRGRELLQAADVVVYDYLANPALLRYAKPEAEFIYVGKQAGQHSMKQEDINALLVRLGREGQLVVRLKGGDPFVFGRGGEEAEALLEAGLSFEIVPGISSVVAVPAYAGIPVTHRNFVSSFTVITGHENANRSPYESRLDWEALAGSSGTLIFLMGVRHLEELSARLIEVGKSPNTPAAVVQWGTTWQQKVVSGTLANIAAEAHQAGIEPPAVTIVGEVAGLRDRLRWFDLPQARPLLGKRIVVTRARAQASSLLTKLSELGADALEFAAFKIVPPADLTPMDAAIAQLDSYDWVVFTSANGPDFFMQRLKAAGKDARAFAKARICAIGPATAQALERFNLKPDLVPEKYVAESILESFANMGNVVGSRFLLARADVAREALAVGLREMGGVVTEVTAYRQVIADEEGPTSTSPATLLKLLEGGQLDAVLFTSSNTVRNFASRLATVTAKPLRELLANTLVACIGPITTAAARDEYELDVQLEAPEYTIERLVQTLVDYFTALPVGV